MQKDTIFFDEKAQETSEILSDINKKEPKEFLDSVFEALEQVNKERRIFSETLRTYYLNYIKNNSDYGFTEKNEANGLFELLSKTSEGLDKKWQVSSRTVRNWFAYSEYSMTKQISKIAFFQVAFALGLSRDEVKTFFMKLFGGVPAFTRTPVDLIFEYCFVNRKSFKEAVLMLERYENLISSEYEKAFQKAYSNENKNYSHFYASAMNCNGGSVSLFNYLVNSVEDKCQTEEFLQTNDLSSYLSSLIKDYENKSGTELNRKSLEETAITLISSKGLKNKYIRRESRDNTRIVSWREGKGTPELTDSFSDRILMYALIKKLGLNKKQISDLILLSAHSKAKRFWGKGYNYESPIDSIADYIETKKDSSLPAACAEDIEIFSYLYLSHKIDIDSAKEKFLNTHGENSIESLFELESNKFIEELIKIRLEFSVNNVRAREMTKKHLNEITESALEKQTILSLVDETDYDEYDSMGELADEDDPFYEEYDEYDEFEDDCKDFEIYEDDIGCRLTKDFWIKTTKEYFEEITANNHPEKSETLYFPWFWVIVTYGYSNHKIIKHIFKKASEEAISYITKNSDLWLINDVNNTVFRKYILNSKDYDIADFYSGSSIFDDNDCWRKYMEYFDENEIRIKYEEAKEAFICCCSKEILNIYEKKITPVFKAVESDDSAESYKRFLCSAFKNMPSPSFVEGNHFEAGKGNMSTYEQLRSLLIFLHFFVFHKSKKKTFKDYQFEINTLLSECGFSRLYSKEPLDFVFLTCAQSDSPVKSFSVLWNLALND